MRFVVRLSESRKVYAKKQAHKKNSIGTSPKAAGKITSN